MNIEFNKNDDVYRQLLFQLKHRKEVISQGGGQKKIESHHKKGKLTSRERIDYLVDNTENFIEIGIFAGEGMYELK
jgi:acetyl-CoA carboxylase carboxyltransferase component